MKLISDWRAAHALYSVRLAGLGMALSAFGAAGVAATAAAGAVWAYVPTLVACGVAFVVFAATLVGRLLKQD